MKSNIILKRIIPTIIFILIIINASLVYASQTVIVINPGHGGEYTGCSNSEKNLVEKDITLKIAKYLEEELNKYENVKTIMTHDGVKFPNNDAGDLAARAMIARNNNADLYVSLHIDDHSNKEVQGATVYTTSREELPKYKAGMATLGNSILSNLNKLGIKTSPLGLVNDKLCNDKEPKFQYYDGSQADYYADIRYCMKGDTDGLGPNFSDGSGIPAVLIEHCYMNNEHDSQFLDSNADLKNLALADANAIIKYFNLKLKEEEQEEEYITSKYEIIGNKITNIEEKLTIEAFTKNITVDKNYNITIETPTKGQEFIGTGTRVIITNKLDNSLVKEYKSIVYGDFNGNGKINTGDVIAIQQVIAGLEEETEIEKTASDLSGNGKLDTGDVIRVQRYIAGITDEIEIKK